MSTTLVYHKPGVTGQVSPFHAAILRLSEGKSVDIACPYLSVEYLRRERKRPGRRGGQPPRRPGLFSSFFLIRSIA